MPIDKLSQEERNQIITAIEEAERNTSGEIRVHLENHCEGDVMDRAAELFAILKMHKTELRNGVLIYLALKDHRFAILGDKGINNVVPDDFWEHTKEIMQTHFKRGHLALGISDGIRMAGEKLAQFFPYQTDDKNELPNDISFNKN